MKRINIVKVLESFGVDLSELRKQHPEDREKVSQFFKFHIGQMGQSNEWVHVESTATSVMEEVLRLPIEVQEGLFAAIAKEVKEPGEQAVLEGDKKRRGARIVRLTSDSRTDHNFLLTH